MSVQQTNKLQELREKCFDRLAKQRQEMIKERRYSQMPSKQFTSQQNSQSVSKLTKAATIEVNNFLLSGTEI
jgi:hypothetical protein